MEDLGVWMALQGIRAKPKGRIGYYCAPPLTSSLFRGLDSNALQRFPLSSAVIIRHVHMREAPFGNKLPDAELAVLKMHEAAPQASNSIPNPAHDGPAVFFHES